MKRSKSTSYTAIIVDLVTIRVESLFKLYTPLKYKDNMPALVA